ncbi:RMD1 family protein [Pseudanabaena sp. FACHB-2040]|uniref:RMD1 family protein n=1 Tax=Pseudanabaena sp. FACHB-2040 TaxID=2692859 RepID=UPI00168723BA|nr:RMD1 family protein [Pseudanabaena sp. FACHB-2040]MBD0268226.1 RMD1 family protein [Cyanobacteria bacterium Co-bin8]MBD2256909.1 RMD1 family protein [Pseudanabaena sp. FACHB-2040]
MSKLLFVDQETVQVQALFLGQRIDLKPFTNAMPMAVSPLMVEAGTHGCAVLFPYGVAVLFGLPAVEQAKFLQDIHSLIEGVFEDPETEGAVIQIAPVNMGKVENGNILLSSLDVPSLQIVAEVMAKSVVLAQYEMGAAKVFDQIEPFAVSLQNLNQTRQQGAVLLKQIGNTLMIQHKMVGRVEIIDKPELLWEFPDLDRLYLRLEDEYEIRERHSALERKLELVTRTAETALDLQQQKTGLRLELYVVILIVVEILLSLYDLVFRS